MLSNPAQVQAKAEPHKSDYRIFGDTVNFHAIVANAAPCWSRLLTVLASVYTISENATARRGIRMAGTPSPSPQDATQVQGNYNVILRLTAVICVNEGRLLRRFRRLEPGWFGVLTLVAIL